VVVESGREAFERRAWGPAYEHLSSSDQLGPDDVELLAVVANLTGRDDDCVAAWERAHHAHQQRGDAQAAARCAFWAGFVLLFLGQSARAGGWFARAERGVAEAGECSTSGFLLVPAFLGAHGSGDVEGARSLAGRIVDIARRCDDPDLLAIGLLCQGEAALALGETAVGMRLLDDAMVSVTTGEVSPIPAGIVYCGVIEACVDAFDLHRAAQWTEALTEWCAQQPDLVSFRGQCLVHRSQVLQARGSWPDATSAAEEAQRRLAEPEHPALGAALYQRGELHRLRGELAAAERAYRQASRHGRDPAPGFELLRLAQGQVAAAVASIQRVIEETRGLRTHPAVLAAAVEILLAAGDAAAAREACDDLAKLTEDQPAPHLQAVAAYCSGSVLLAERDAVAAIVELRRAAAAWRELEMPYEAARASVQIARCCRALSDHDAADWQLETALETFEHLGARTELARAGRLARPSGGASGVLTERQCDVLRAVATGRSNREVAADLGISEHTVARHLQNIFTKLDLSSRAAATAYAHEHGLI
jgi:DNA-binding CsgD family transcriptional regulator